MNAAAYLIEALCVASLGFMTWSWLRSGAGVRVLMHLLAAVVSVAGIVVIPIVAKPGDQPGWTQVIIGTLIAPLVVGVTDLRLTRR